MPHFYVDDGMHSSPKHRAVSVSAVGLWVLAGSQSADALTEGLVPMWFVRSIPSGMRLARELVDVRVPGSATGLWHAAGESCDSKDCPAQKNPVPDQHFAFHDWAKSNTRTKAAVEAERAAGRERQRRWAERQRDGSANGVSTVPQSSPVHRETSSQVPHVVSAPVHEVVDNYSAAVELTRGRLADAGDGSPVSKSAAARVVDAILARAKTTPRNAERYVRTALNRDPFEWLDFMNTGKDAS